MKALFKQSLSVGAVLVMLGASVVSSAHANGRQVLGAVVGAAIGATVTSHAQYGGYYSNGGYGPHRGNVAYGLQPVVYLAPVQHYGRPGWHGRGHHHRHHGF